MSYHPEASHQEPVVRRLPKLLRERGFNVKSINIASGYDSGYVAQVLAGGTLYTVSRQPSVVDKDNEVRTHREVLTVRTVKPLTGAFAGWHECSPQMDADNGQQVAFESHLLAKGLTAEEFAAIGRTMPEGYMPLSVGVEKVPIPQEQGETKEINQDWWQKAVSWAGHLVTGR